MTGWLQWPKFCQILKDELTPVLHKLFQKILEEGTLPISVYEDNTT